MSLVQVIKIAQKRAGIDADAHRANIRDINAAADSCTQLSRHEQQVLLTRYQGMNRQTTNIQLPPLRKKIYRLWSELARTGKVNTDSKRACDAWFQRTFHRNVDTANSQRWYDAVDALQAWLMR